MKRSGHHILLAVPTRGMVQWQTITRLNEVRDETPGLRPILFQPGNLSVAQTRNRIVAAFMQTDCSTLVMVDDDVVPPPHFLRIDEFLTEYELVAVPHPMPEPQDPSKIALTAYNHADEGLRGATLEEGMNEVDAVATGCVAIAREALAVLGENPFRIDHAPDGMSDDFLFCADLKAAGFRIGAWWDGWYCDHISSVSLAPLLESQQRKPATAERSFR